MKTPTWSYRGVLHGLQLGSALSGRLELRGKLSPCGGGGLVQASGYSAENISKPPEKKKQQHTVHQITAQSPSSRLITGSATGGQLPPSPGGGSISERCLLRQQLGMQTAVSPVVRIRRNNQCEAVLGHLLVLLLLLFLPFRINTLAPQRSRHRAATASISVPSFFA